MRGVEMTVCQREVGKAQGRAGNVGKDGVAFFEEGIKGPGQAVVVELIGRDVPEILGAMFAGPVGDVDQRGRRVQTGSQEDFKSGAVGNVGIAGKMPSIMPATLSLSSSGRKRASEPTWTALTS